MTIVDLLNNETLKLELVVANKDLEHQVIGVISDKSMREFDHCSAECYRHLVKLFGPLELSRWKNLSEISKQEQVIENLKIAGISAMVICNNLNIPIELKNLCEEKNIPLLRSKLMFPIFLKRLTSLFEFPLEKYSTIHGVMVDVFGLGILIVGESGIGKSECALDLVSRGHKLVADDLVELKIKGSSGITGHCSKKINYHMEIRGLGIINIKELYGISSICEEKELDLVVELVAWKDNEEYDRLGLDELYYNIIGVDLPKIIIPLRPGRNSATLLDVAARNHLLKMQGYYSAREFQESLIRQ